MTTQRSVAACIAAALALAACGGDDTPAAEPPAAETPADEPAAEPVTSDAADGSVEGPVSTLSPEIPEEFLPGIGPVDVIGDSLPPLENEADDPAVGLPAPTLVGLDLDRRPIRIEPGTDGPMMVVFVAHWCPHCNDELPRLNQLRDAGRFPDELSIVAVNTAVSPTRPNWPPDQWLTDTMDWTYPAMFDGVDIERQAFIAADAYGVSGFPFVVLLDAGGDVAARWSGEREPDQVIEMIETSLGLG